MGRQRVEQLLGGALSHNKLGQNLSGYYTLCYECRLKSELTPDDQCSVHADSHILALSLDREGYVDSLLGDSLEVDGVRFDKGQKIGEIVGVLNLRKTYAPESFMLPWGQQVFLNSADGKLVSVKVTE